MFHSPKIEAPFSGNESRILMPEEFKEAKDQDGSHKHGASSKRRAFQKQVEEEAMVSYYEEYDDEEDMLAEAV